MAKTKLNIGDSLFYIGQAVKPFIASTKVEWIVINFTGIVYWWGNNHCMHEDNTYATHEEAQYALAELKESR